MKITFKDFLNWVLIIAGLYGLSAFIGGDFNPMNWHWFLRLISSIIAILISAFQFIPLDDQS